MKTTITTEKLEKMGK